MTNVMLEFVYGHLFWQIAIFYIGLSADIIYIYIYILNIRPSIFTPHKLFIKQPIFTFLCEICETEFMDGSVDNGWKCTFIFCPQKQ